MKSTEHWIVHDHTHIEILLGQCRDAAEIEDWWALNKAIIELTNVLNHHMGQEEEVLFPAFNAKTRAPHIPTASLCDEHDQMVEIFRDLITAMNDKNSLNTVAMITKLELLMTKHHEKEEDMFIPMASHILYEEREELSQMLDDFVAPKSPKDWGL